MQGLLLRLSETDAAASAMRVIAFFDMLLERRASPRALVQATSGLAQCVVGWRNANGVVVRLAPSSIEGWQLGGALSPSAELEVPGHGVVWLERHGNPEPYDDLILERLALVAGALMAGRSAHDGDRRHIDAPKVLLTPTASEDERLANARTLGLRVDKPLVSVAIRHCTNRDPQIWARDLAEHCWPADRVYATRKDGIAAVIVQQVVPGPSVEESLSAYIRERAAHEPSFESNLRAGIGVARSVTEAHLSWTEAKVALRFAGATRTDVVIDYRHLGSLRLLAQTPVAVLRADPGVQVITSLRAQPGGADEIAVLQAFCRTGSLRQASNELHLHHSTVASHLARISANSGWNFGTSIGRLAALAAIYAEQLCRA